MLVIDGAYGEGGGQLLRTAVALSAITRQAVRMSSIRARRSRPGLAAQHIAAVRAVAALCDARVSGLVPRSTEIEFEPGPVRGGSFRFEVGTAGSAVLVLQALMPVALAGGVACRVVVTGGTDVRGAPPADYVQSVVLPLLARMGAKATLAIVRRGYYPGGGGEIELAIERCGLRAQRWMGLGRVRRIEGRAHVARLPLQIAERMRAAALRCLAAQGLHATIAASALDERQAYGPGGALALWAEGDGAVLGSARVAERGIRAEALGEAVAGETAADVAAGAALDVHAADQMLVYLALAHGVSEFTTREVTTHTRTAAWLIERFLHERFDIVEERGVFRVEVRGAGILPPQATPSP
jgi:RNA 3'-terminal phosphate cyclase (ATP)